jgi:hypothetical protein
MDLQLHAKAHMEQTGGAGKPFLEHCVDAKIGR